MVAHLHGVQGVGGSNPLVPTSELMNILVTNDDGYDAPGIRHLLSSMEGMGNIMLAAPDQNHSGASSSLTLSRSISVHQPLPGHYRIGGTPSDCIHLAMTGDFLPMVPDLIVSGINDGANMGDDTIYSGTVAAVIEGHLFGVPGFAFSMAGKSARHFAVGAAVARHFVMQFKQKKYAGLPLLNINIPDAPAAQLADIAVTRLGRRHPAQPAICRATTDDGGRVFVIGDAGAAQDNSPGTDFYAVERGQISVTPLMIDLTDAAQMARLEAWLK